MRNFLWTFLVACSLGSIASFFSHVIPAFGLITVTVKFALVSWACWLLWRR